jgi:hypothetical protein
MKLRFLKPWSTYMPGQIMLTDSPVTVYRLVSVHQVAEIVPAFETQVVRVESTMAKTVTLDSPIKDIGAPPKDKMVRAAGKAKMRRRA